MNKITKRLAVIGLSLSVVATTVSAANAFLGFSSEGRTGGDLTNAEKGTVQSAINLIEGAGESFAAATLRIMLANGEINREDNPDASGTGNSSLKSDNDPNNPDNAMNVSPKTLDPALDAKAGALADLAGVLMHEYLHLFDIDENEAMARVAQANVLCGIACIGVEGGISAKDKEAICKEYASVVFFGSQASNLAAAGLTMDEYMDLVDCPCCEETSGIAGDPMTPPSPAIAAAAASVPANWSPGAGVYSPSSDTVHWPDYSFSASSTPQLQVNYYQASDGRRKSLVVPLGIYPTAIDGDEFGNIYVGGKNASGKSVVVRYVFTYVGDVVTASAPSIVLASSKISVISQLTHVDHGGADRLFALDGASGKIGYLDISTGVLTTMASATTDPQMTGWKSFIVNHDVVTGSLTVELSRDFPLMSIYRSGEYLYVLYDNNYDGVVDSTLYDLVENIAYPD